MDQLDEAARVAPTPWVLAVGARSAALLAAAEGDLDAAAIALRPRPARARRPRRCRSSAAGPCWRRAASTGAARRSASPTRRCARRSPASTSSARRTGPAKAREELGRVGRRPHAPEGLTDTERRVAELAATGLSNREVAERAFLAPKTVGNVLGRVYEKLGIHSRAELGALLASGALLADEVIRSID